MVKKRKKIITGAVLLFLALLLDIAARTIDGFAQWYSTHLYPVWVNTIGRAAGQLPFSVSEIMIIVLLVWMLGAVLRAIIRCVRSKAGKNLGIRTSADEAGICLDKQPESREWLGNLVLAVGILAFLYAANCGVNYYRDSFSECAGIQVEEYSAEELREVCQWLTQEVNAYSGKVSRDADGVMTDALAIDTLAVEAMESLGKEYLEMKGFYPQPKGLLNSWALSIQGLSGIYLPFAVEANYNRDMTDYNIPFTVCHELSHLRGFMQEQEANFIAFLACRGSEEDAFRYSGNLLAWIKCMNVLYKVDYDGWETVRGNLDPEVEADLKANREFWAKYDGTVAEVSNKVNDTYLKANGQEDGVKSYDRMVDLVVAYYRKDSAIRSR